mmetsp:Transcript_8171/g.15833  ORF Transcript_8171/g.15833 Transcript_8171/m.15833 type:complete len:287 (+) Transcript_8171:42-902(+)
MTRGRRINSTLTVYRWRLFFLSLPTILFLIGDIPLLSVTAFLIVPFEKIPQRHHGAASAPAIATATPATTSTSLLSMMKGSVFCAVTLDGFIATPDGDVSFLNDFGDPSSSPPPEPKQDAYSFESFLDTVDIMIMGRKTFEKVLSFGRDMWAYGGLRIVVWTTQTDYNGIPDYLQDSVGCSNLSPTVLWDELKSQGHENAYIDGGSTIQHFAKDDLIEDWIITTVPMFLGEGIRLFTPEYTRRLRLDHVHTQASAAGLVTSHYRSRREGAKQGEDNSSSSSNESDE